VRDVEIVGTTPADPGVEHTWLESFFPVRMPHGPVVGVAAIARDETRVHTLQRQLHSTLERQRGAIARVQESLMPGALPSVPGFDLAGTYQSAEDEVSLGGDWFDVVRAPDGRLVVSVGDAVGHGLTGVGVMARASSAVRAYLCEGHGPARVLTLLNGLLGTPDSAGLASAVVVAVDTVTGELEYASAGHPYPLVRGTSGDVVALAAAQGPLLGAADRGAYHAATARLDGGATLLLYTDGLIERREESLEHGQRRLEGALSGSGTDSAGIVRAALRACLGDRERSDDVCLLAVTRLPAGG
jgi:serine phosphatase RsbU (regulator of sigma subunit)